MADDLKISGLPAATEPIAGDDLIAVTNVSEPGTGKTEKRTQDELLASQLNLNFRTATELTISGGEITVTQSNHKLQPESGTTDDLDTISGTAAGKVFVFYVSDAGTDTITIKHGTGNISCLGASDVDLSQGSAIFYSDGTTVYLIGGGGGGGGVTDHGALTGLADDDHTQYILHSLATAANDFLVASGSGVVVKKTLTETKTILGIIDPGIELISDTVLSSDTASFDFTSIPATYKHLRLILSLRTDRETITDALKIQFNGDTGTNYDGLYYSITHSGSLATTENLAYAGAYLTGCCGNSSPASSFSAHDIFIPNYANTSINKSLYVSAGVPAGTTTGTLSIRNGIAVWKSTAAINRITLLPIVGPNWKQYSRATLYGLR